jgi:hypothetical protein
MVNASSPLFVAVVVKEDFSPGVGVYGGAVCALSSGVTSGQSSKKARVQMMWTMRKVMNSATGASIRWWETGVGYHVRGS